MPSLNPAYPCRRRRGKQYRRLMKALNGATATRAISRFARHTLAVVAILLAAHLAFYIASSAQLGEQAQNVVDLDEAGDAVDWLHWMLLHQQVLLLLAQNRSAPGGWRRRVDCSSPLAWSRTCTASAQAPYYAWDRSSSNLLANYLELAVLQGCLPVQTRLRSCRCTRKPSTSTRTGTTAPFWASTT